MAYFLFNESTKISQFQKEKTDMTAVTIQSELKKEKVITKCSFCYLITQNFWQTQ